MKNGAKKGQEKGKKGRTIMGGGVGGCGLGEARAIALPPRMRRLLPRAFWATIEAHIN